MLVNNNEFLIKDSEIPKVPVEFSEDALLWYREQKKRCIEGYSVGGKWMPPQLYFYINFWKIELQRGKSKSKVVDRPMLRDVEWEIFLPYIVCRGLSGFDDIEISEKQEVVLDAIKNGSFSGVPNYNNQALDLEIMTARETGKANWCESTCYTPYGKKRWGDLSVGDYIFGNDGNPTQILKVFPQGKIPLYKITLRDGRETICSGEHLWNVYTKTPEYLRHIYGNRMIKTLTTNDLIKNFKIDRKKCYKNKNGFEARYYLPTSDAVKFNINKNHYISPYILGALIGDGGLTINVTIVNNDIEVISNICNELDDLHLLKKIESAKYGYNIISKQKSGGNKLKNELRRLGLFGKKSTHKFIPEEYLYSSIENRMSLLQGLMDTDGYIDEKGLIEFGTTSEQLSKDIMFLCRSLGINCKYTKSKLLYTNNTCYRVRIYTDKNIFRIKRKLNRIKPRTKFSASRIERNAIVDIKYVFDDDAMCVMVDNDSHLYLIDDFIVTHNSFCASALIAHEWLFNGQRSYIDNTSIDFRKTKSNITVGAGDSKLSSRLMIKVKLGLDCLAKSGIQFGGVYYPHPFFQRYTGSFNAGKSIVAKYTKKVGNSWIDEGSFSAINHVSYKDNPFAAQGSRNNLMIKEEIGMFSNLEAAYNADVETMMSGTNKYGTCVYIGTGGDMESGTIGAYKMFYSPRTFDMLPFYDKWENKGEIGLFIPATMRPNEFKDDNGNTNFEQATKFFVEKREELRSKKNSANSLDEHIQYNPLVPSEAFLRTSNNIFPVAEMKEWLSEIESKRIYRDAEYICDLVLDDEFDNGIKPQMNPNLRPIYDFPIDKGKDVTGAIIIYFHPDENQQFGRYIAGIDPYDFNKAENSMSLGSMIVMDRLSGYIMCEYSGRPRFADQFYENCRRIAIYYNACVLYENEKQGVKQYFEKKNALGYLMPQPKYIKDIIPTSTVERGFGIHMNQQIKDHGEILLRDWLQTEFEGMLNLKRIRSQTILKELIMYDDVNNFDRVMSMMCLMYALQEMHKQKVITSQSKATDKFFERKLFQKNAIMQYR